jgi:hypothetical protein
MGLFMRRRRPLARLAAGAATAGVAYNMGRRREEAEGETSRDAATAGPYEAAPPPQYAPHAPPAAGPGKGTSATAELERLADLRRSGALSDEEFKAAKSKLLGLA